MRIKMKTKFKQSLCVEITRFLNDNFNLINSTPNYVCSQEEKQKVIGGKISDNKDGTFNIKKGAGFLSQRNKTKGGMKMIDKKDIIANVV